MNPRLPKRSLLACLSAVHNFPYIGPFRALMKPPATLATQHERESLFLVPTLGINIETISVVPYVLPLES